MKKIKKILSLALAALALLTTLSACSGRKKGDPPVYTSDKTVVLTLGGYNVTKDFYRYLFLNTKQFYDGGDETYWEGKDVSIITDDVLKSLKKTYAMFKLADEYKIELTDEDDAYIDEYIAQSKEGMTDDEYLSSLDEAYMTEELYRFVMEVQQLEYLVYSHIINDENGILRFTDDDLTKAVKSDFVRASHILFTYKNDEEKTEAQKDAEAVLEKLKNGEDFEKLKEEYSDDPALKGNSDGYYFTHGEFETDFEYTAYALKEGEISEVISTPVGYHIVKRLPLEDEYINDNFETIRGQYKTSLYYKMVEEETEKLTAEYKKDFADIKLDSFE